MTTVAESILPALELARSQAGVIGWHIHSVDLVVSAWSGAHTGDGTETAATRRLVEANGQNPKVHWLNDEELALGNLESGSCEIGPMTPLFATGGTALAWLGGELASGQTLHLIITGIKHPEGAVYRVKNADQETPTKLMLTCVPVGNA